MAVTRIMSDVWEVLFIIRLLFILLSPHITLFCLNNYFWDQRQAEVAVLVTTLVRWGKAKKKMWMRRKSEIQIQRRRDIRCSRESVTSLSGHFKLNLRNKKIPFL